MVSQRETIKGFALACKRFALDCPPKGDHARAKPLILCKAQAWFPFCFPKGNNQKQSRAFKIFDKGN